MFNFSEIDDERAEASVKEWEKNIAYRKKMQTSHGRFHVRIETYREQGKSVLVHHFWWFVHNCVAHPMIGLVPIKPTFQFHDFTSDKINLKGASK